MNWIIIVAIVLLAERDYINNLNLIFGTDAGPVPITGQHHHINPFILHWEPAHFDRNTLEQAHQKHLEQQNRRRKRDLNNNYENGPAHTIKLKFSAHDREFRLVLYQNPLSVFAPDVEIENTLGPVDYDISRIYTGSLEDDENSHVHAVLTKNNLIDGTISTKTEQYYIEPAERYSNDLINSGIHTIVYKLSDVKMNNKKPSFTISNYFNNDFSRTPIMTIESPQHHCASENLRKKLEAQRKTKDFKRRRKSSLSISPLYLNSIFYNNENNKNDNNMQLLSFPSNSLKLAPLANNSNDKKLNNKNNNNFNSKNNDKIKNYKNYDDSDSNNNIINSDTIRNNENKNIRNNSSSDSNKKSNIKKINNSSFSLVINNNNLNSKTATNNNDENNDIENKNSKRQKMSNKMTFLTNKSQNNLKYDASDIQKDDETVNFHDNQIINSIKSINNYNIIDIDDIFSKKILNENLKMDPSSDMTSNRIDVNISLSKNSYDVNPSRSKRRKRWLPDELSDNRDPPLPLDLDVPYNDEFSLFERNSNTNLRNNGKVINNSSGSNGRSSSTSSTNNSKGNASTSTSSGTGTIRTNSKENLVIGIGRSPTTNQNSGNRNVDIRNIENFSGNGGGNGNSFSNSNSNSNSNSGDIITGNGIYLKNNRNRNILVNQYSPNNPNSDFTNNINNNNNNNNNNYYSNISNNGRQNNYNNNHRNIIGNSYNGDNSNFNSNTKIRTIFNTNFDIINNNNNNFNLNGGGNSSPSHKTHVEIITRNGATKRPNIIGNNYNPDVYLTNTKNGNSKINSHLNLNIRNELDSSLSSSTSARPSLYDRKSTCMLYLQADHTFFQKMGSDEASIEAITRHVQRANTIYKNTDFNNDGKPDNITFMIKRIKVHNANAVKDPSYRFPGNYGVEKFLELFSEEDYDAFCLAYMFTYRDFEMGTLGLAWTGDLKNAGGVCEKNGHYRGSLKSLNTGIVTLLNYGKHVPPAVSHVTLAHEIGHNFGSPHDPEQCTPGGEDGNYIMFARATSGDKRNNNKFSPCSLKSIEPVLNAKARSAKGCFTEPQTSICGNGVVEPGEECDCGWEEDCNDVCCFPMSRHPRIDERPCTLQPRAMCSPSQGPCCTTQCNLKFGDKCRDDNGCRDPSFCDGRQPQCPPSVNKPNKTICNKEFVCYMGECTGSICLAFGLESCQCLPGPNDPKTKSCELCCKEPGEGKSCKSSFEWNEQPYDVPDMFAKPGTPCNDYNGYCDVFQKCREVDPSGPLATLRKLLLSEESIASFKKWIQSNWYTVALAAVGVIVLLILSTKLLGKRNVKLKSVTIIHSATTETVRLPEDNNGVIVHTAVRTKVPFKKKVRGQRSHKTKIITKKSTQQKISSKSNTKVGNGNPPPVGGSGGVPPTQSTSNIVSPAITTTSISANKNSPTATTTTVIPKIPSTVLNKRSSGEVLKKVSRKKIRTSLDDKVSNKLSDFKKSKKLKKKNEIIDYSKSIAGPNNAHTNTFGKVQKWLLDSPIVAQPLSHIEHSSKVRNIMTKSQSTPDRLIQKSPQKTKSVGNLSNEKVKLQVVYKPPFKFSLKLSKNSAVKTHVIGGGLGKSKRKSRPTGIDKKKVGVAPIASSKSSDERGRRAALLVRSTDKTDGLKLNLMENSEPNYETLEHPDKMSDKTPLYENMQVNSTENLRELSKSIDTLDITNLHKSSNKNNKPPDVFRINRSASNSHIDCSETNTNKNQQPHSYSRSNSVSHNTGAAALRPISSSRKASDTSVNLSRNFGSTQNLIPNSHNNLSKSKKRSSLNLKNNSVSSSDTKRPSISKKPLTPDGITSPIGLAPARRSSSNQNLRRENSSSNLRRSDIADIALPQQQKGSTNNLLKSSSSNGVKGTMKNIPRASLSNNANTHALLVGASQQLNNLSNINSNNSYHIQQQQTKQRTPSPPTNNLVSANINNTNNGNLLLRQQSHNPNVNYNALGNQLSNFNYNNLNKPHTAGCDDFHKSSPFEWPKNFTNACVPLQHQQQIQQHGASTSVNHSNRNSYNSSNSSRNNSISNSNGSNSSNSINNTNNIASNAAILSNNIINHHSSINFMTKSQQQLLQPQQQQQLQPISTINPSNSIPTATNITNHTNNINVNNKNKFNISNSITTPTIATTTATNNSNYNDQKNNLNISNNKNFNNKLSASLKQNNGNNENINNDNSITPSDLEVMISDVENLVS